MDLSKKMLASSAVSLFLISVMSAIVVFIGVDNGTIDNKAMYVFQLIFSLAIMITVSVSAFLMQRDGMLESQHYVILGGIFIIGLFDMISASILIDLINNPIGATTSGIKAAAVLPAIAGVLNVPAMVGAGYLLAI